MPDPINAPAPSGQPAPPPAPPPAPLTGAPQDDQSYSFITNPPEQPKKSFMESLPGGGSLPARIALIAGAVLVLFILLLILRSVFSGGGNNAVVLTTVVQDQQELIHLTSNASSQNGLSSTNKNLSATAMVSLASSQSDLITYLAQGGKKLNKKEINMKVSTTTDDQLTAAAASGTYNQTYHDIIKTALNDYGNDIQAAYQQDKGKNARAILTDCYKQAQLLGTQLNSGS